MFPNGTRNCYTLRPDEGKGNTYLVRASFWYGNYDGKNQTPAFDLHIDVNYWITVNSSSWTYEEIIYTPPRDYIQVCLVNTGSGVPFISALELRLLDNSTYQINSGALVNDWRSNLGSTDTYRHPKDVYDRIWHNDTYSEDLSSVSNTTAIVTSTSNDAYKVPPEVLMTATQTQNVTDPLFWEPVNSATACSLCGGLVNAMYDIKKTYGVIRESWQGDPCVPTQYSWSGLNCSYDGSPRIVSLNLSSSGLKGPIATSISNLTAIVYLDLSNNSLTGSIPDFLAQMPSLEVLNLGGNDLNGSVPKTLLKKKADGSLQLSLDGNPNLCRSDNCSTSNVQPKKKGIPIAPIIASVAAALVLILLGALAVLWIIRRRLIQRPIGTSRLSKDRHFTSTEVTRITDNFRTVIGEGGFGKVYLGRLGDGTQVAVKMLSRSSKQGYKEFHTEAQLLMLIHHRNLVSLIGYCEEFENLALIYEFMSNGNVRQHLSAPNPNVLSWSQRLQIAIDAAQ
ncbi:hypothetical protein BT93_L3629, partial [Corymbia citriodora subsp. variegata]